MQKRLTEQGLRFLEEGQFEKAGHILSLLISHFPQNAEAHHMLGIIELEKGNYDQAYVLVNTAIDLDDTNSVFYNTMGNIELHRNRIANAEAAFKNAVKFNSDKIEYKYNLANFYLTQNQYTNAIDHFYMILQNNPTHYLSVRGITVSYLYSGEIDIALEHATEWAQEFSEYDEPYYYLGLCLYALNDISGALTAYDKGLSLAPTNHEILAAIGACYRTLGNRKIAETYLHNALGIEPRNPVAVSNLGSLHLDNGDLDSAAKLFNNAISLDPTYAEPQCGLGNVEILRGNITDALAHFSAAKRIEPHNNTAQYLYATTLLRDQKFQEGWLALKNILSTTAAIRQIPSWQGQQLRDEKLLVWIPKETNEILLQVLFSSMLPDIIKLAPNVVLLADPILVPVFKLSFPTIKVCSALKMHVIGSEEISYQVPISALGYFVRRSVQDFARNDKKFLQADPIRAQHYKEKYCKLFRGKKLIGISWKGSRNAKNIDYATTIQLNLWTKILSNKDCQFIALQFGEIANEVKMSGELNGGNIYIEENICNAENLNTVELCAAMSALDAIITVDNIVCHLAGGLGLKTQAIVALPAAWYWFKDGSDTLWYENVTLLRQKTFNKWHDVFEKASSYIDN